jgi:beta-N-acetylhexosaminidase
VEGARRGPRIERRLGKSLRALSVVALLLAFLVGCAGPSEREGDKERRSENNHPAEKATEMGKRPAGVGQMSLRDMVGQMFMISIGGTEPNYYVNKMIRERNIGGVLLFEHNMKSEAQTRRLTGALQRLSMHTEPAVPLFTAVDHEGGEISHAPWVAPQPAAARVGARGDPAEARAIAERMGKELLGAGVNTDLAPVVDTGFGAAIGRRSFGEDPQLVAEMGAAAVEGFKTAGVVCAAKHFPNHGAATTDSHVSLPVVDHDLPTLRSRDLPPFEAAIEAGAPMVMVGHLLYPAVDPERPASLSPRAVGMLRGELGFGGVVVTDDLAMAGASGEGPPARAAVEAVKAGADLLIISSPPQQQADAYDAVVAAVESGEISQKRVRASVERILKVKKDYSLDERGAR